MLVHIETHLFHSQMHFNFQGEIHNISFNLHVGIFIRHATLCRLSPHENFNLFFSFLSLFLTPYFSLPPQFMWETRHNLYMIHYPSSDWQQTTLSVTIVFQLPISIVFLNWQFSIYNYSATSRMATLLFHVFFQKYISFFCIEWPTIEVTSLNLGFDTTR